MTDLAQTSDHRLAPARDEAGTAPGDRAFRPDIQGLRAVAILLVVLFHAGVPGMAGGYVGVDVFFVISGFVITGVLLRERAAEGTTSLVSFYGRRARRIIPAASLVIVITVLATYALVGSLTGRESAVDGRWAAVFMANVHFAASETNYLASQLPPSPLQNYWSLAVEEQFYIVYPTLFLLVAGVAVRRSLRSRLVIVLGAVIVASYTLSIVQTSTDAPGAFFSPFTRAWELALGGLICVVSERLRRLPVRLTSAASWIGLAAILVAATTYTSATAYPGWLVAVPVLGAGLIIAGGSAGPAAGVELLLRRQPFQWLGLVSYSWYLWHWPMLVIAADRRGTRTLPLADNLLLVVAALGLAACTYAALENPVRHARRLRRRRWTSVTLGGALVAATLLVTTVAVRSTPPGLSGSITVAPSGSNCQSPSRQEIASLRSVFLHQYPSAGRGPSSRLRMLVVGDSTACTMMVGLAAVGASYGVQVDNGAVIGCGIVSGATAPFVDAAGRTEEPTRDCYAKALRTEMSALRRSHPDLVLWTSTDERNSIVATPGGRVLEAGSAPWRTELSRRMESRLTRFIATGARVVMLLEPSAVHGGDPAKSSAIDDDYRQMNSLIRQVAAKHPRQVAVVDLSSRVCPGGPPCPYVVDGVGRGKPVADSVRPDGLHYGSTGALWVASWLVPRIVDSARHLQ